MNNRENVKAILNYENYERMPVVSFGYWPETLEKWHREGHVTEGEWKGYQDNSPEDNAVMKKLGFDFNWNSCFSSRTGLFPYFERKLLEDLGNGKRKIIDENGLIVIEQEDVVSIPSEVGTLFEDRKTWEELYLPKLRYTDERINQVALDALKIKADSMDIPIGIHCGSLFGKIRDWLGVEGVSYLSLDDPDLYDEIINSVGDICYRVTEKVLQSGIKFDYGHFWEDICFKNGPLVIPTVFNEKVGPHYKRISELLKSYNINILSVDCDGLIDSLIPTWVENGVNTMFPIEVGTWKASIEPWREKYGKQLRGVGGMDKKVFAYDYAAIDEEIERLRKLIDLGGYIPCPDHRIPPDAKWENVQYYCEKMRRI